jgi:hypothetical protein
MSDAAGEGAHGFHFLRLDHLLFEAGAGVLGFLARGDVVNEALVITRGALKIADDTGAFGNPDDGAIAATDLVFEAADLAVRLDFLTETVAEGGVHVDLMADVGDGAKHLGGAGITVHLGEGGIDGEIVAIGRALVDAFDGVLEDAAITGLGFLQLLLAVSAFGDVGEESGEVTRRVGGGGQGSEDEFAGNGGMVASATAEFETDFDVAGQG